MWKMISAILIKKSMPMVGFLTRDILRAKTSPYRRIGYQTNIPPTTCTSNKGKQTNKQTSGGSTCGGVDAGGGVELCSMWSLIHNRGFQSWPNEFRTSFSNDFRMREFKSDSKAI